MKYIIGSAIKTDKCIALGLRHSDCYKVLESVYGTLLNLKQSKIQEQGFITNEMQFVSREEAFHIVLENDQEIISDRRTMKALKTRSLMSEDLW